MNNLNVTINGSPGVYTGEVNSSNLPHGEGEFDFGGGLNYMRVYDGEIFGLGKFNSFTITYVYTVFGKFPSGNINYGEFRKTHWHLNCTKYLK